VYCGPNDIARAGNYRPPLIQTTKKETTNIRGRTETSTYMGQGETEANTPNKRRQGERRIKRLVLRITGRGGGQRLRSRTSIRIAGFVVRLITSLGPVGTAQERTRVQECGNVGVSSLGEGPHQGLSTLIVSEVYYLK